MPLLHDDGLKKKFSEHFKGFEDISDAPNLLSEETQQALGQKIINRLQELWQGDHNFDWQKVAAVMATDEGKYSRDPLEVWNKIKPEGSKSAINSDNVKEMLSKNLKPNIETAKVVNKFEDEMMEMPIKDVRNLERKIGKDNGLYSRRVTTAEIEEELNHFEDEDIKKQVMELPLNEAREMLDRAKDAADFEEKEESRQLEMNKTETEIDRIEKDLAKTT